MIAECNIKYKSGFAALLFVGGKDQSAPLWLIDVREKQEVARDGKIPKSVNLPLGELKKALLADCEEFDVTYGFSKPEKHHENIIFYRYKDIGLLTGGLVSIKRGVSSFPSVMRF